ncbi:MAG: RtcB family protein [Candidatus Schekmanbacteria bacterium]|nr:RtcB family protein [Candidatus Schekmanbacteria bacterium]
MTAIPLKKIDDYRWELPIGYVPGMRVPGRVYADEQLLADIMKDESLKQVANAATLPGIIGASLAMPDIHYGYGLPIGGVLATDVSDGIISPGATGYDINCGVRLIRTNLTRQDLPLETLKTLVAALFAKIPTGVGSHGKIKLSAAESRKVLTEGAAWAVKKGYGQDADLEHSEAGGCLEGADSELVSDRAHERGAGQLGTLGSGNHFLEIQYVDEIYNSDAAKVLGLAENQITVMIHTGSRGLGHQICTDYLGMMGQALTKYKIELPDRQLACAPFKSKEGQQYLAAMRAAANFAWANRQCLMYWAFEVFLMTLNISPKALGFNLIYDLAHNIVKIEKHQVEGKTRELVVHRKGATRAFPSGHDEVPAAYKSIGQPVLIPGDMGRCSYVLMGTQAALEETFGSTCHGAGRVLSRHQAIKQAKGRSIYRELEDKGIIIKTAGRETLAEEMPEAYKDVSQVVEVVHQAGISGKVARLRPLGVIKG